MSQNVTLKFVVSVCSEVTGFGASDVASEIVPHITFTRLHLMIIFSNFQEYSASFSVSVTRNSFTMATIFCRHC